MDSYFPLVVCFVLGFAIGVMGGTHMGMKQLTQEEVFATTKYILKHYADDGVRMNELLDELAIYTLDFTQDAHCLSGELIVALVASVPDFSKKNF